MQLYIEFLASPEKYFCIHFEIGIKDREPGVRFTFTNMEKDYAISGGNVKYRIFRPWRYPSSQRAETFGLLPVSTSSTTFKISDFSVKEPSKITQGATPWKAFKFAPISSSEEYTQVPTFTTGTASPKKWHSRSSKAAVGRTITISFTYLQR